MPDSLVVVDEHGKERALAAAVACAACKDGVEQPFPFSMAFQPIVNVSTGKIFAYEALVRGSGTDTTSAVMSKLTPENLYAFDQTCRVKAITLAAKLGLAETGALLSINFIPGAVYSPVACLRLTIETADNVGFPADQLMFEVTEGEKVRDIPHLQGIVNEYRKRGFKVALDDMGSAFSGLDILSDLPVDVIKLDIALIHHLSERTVARAIVAAMVTLSETLGIQLIAEGVERVETYRVLRELGVSLMQGYLLARPEYERLPEFTLPN